MYLPACLFHYLVYVRCGRQLCYLLLMSLVSKIHSWVSTYFILFTSLSAHRESIPGSGRRIEKCAGEETANSREGLTRARRGKETASSWNPERQAHRRSRQPTLVKQRELGSAETVVTAPVYSTVRIQGYRSCPLTPGV